MKGIMDETTTEPKVEETDYLKTDRDESGRVIVGGPRCPRCEGPMPPDKERYVMMEVKYGLEELDRIPFYKSPVFIPERGLRDIEAFQKGRSILGPTGEALVPVTAARVVCKGPMTPLQAYIARCCLSCRAEFIAMVETWWIGRTHPFAHDLAIDRAREMVKVDRKMPEDERKNYDLDAVPVRIFGANVTVSVKAGKVSLHGENAMRKGRRQKPHHKK